MKSSKRFLKNITKAQSCKRVERIEEFWRTPNWDNSQKQAELISSINSKELISSNSKRSEFKTKRNFVKRLYLNFTNTRCSRDSDREETIRSQTNLKIIIKVQIFNKRKSQLIILTKKTVRNGGFRMTKISNKHLLKLR